MIFFLNEGWLPRGRPAARSSLWAPRAVARLDVTVLPRFEAEWAAATAQARDEYSVVPVQHFTERWWLWVAVRRWPELAAQLRECERSRWFGEVGEVVEDGPGLGESGAGVVKTWCS